MVSAKDVINSTRSKPIKLPKGDTQLGSAGYDNPRDDIERVKKMREGLCEKVPTLDNDIANKKYVDDNAGGVSDHSLLNELDYASAGHTGFSPDTHTHTHASTTGQTTDDHHNESHDIASHSDTTATGAELNSLTDNSIVNTLHRHSELVASDGYPDPAVSVVADGDVKIHTRLGVGTSTPSYLLHIKSATSDADMAIDSGSGLGDDSRIRFLRGGTSKYFFGVKDDNNLQIYDYTLGGVHTMFKAGGNIDSTGYVSGKKSGVFAYLTEAANTTITTAGTYYPIAGTFTNAPIEDFGAATTYTPGIKYTGTKTQYFEVDWHASGYGDAAGQTIHMGIKKNNVLCTGSVMGTFLKFLGEEQALSGTCVIELATNDEIQLVITSDSNGDVITLEHFTTTITEFFD